jgi:hypothetical protein
MSEGGGDAMLTSNTAGRSTAYYEALRAIRELNPEDWLDMLVDITNMLRSTPLLQPRHSVMELEGLGAELWKQIDVDEYIEMERASWNG